MAEYQQKYKARLKAEGKWLEAEKCEKYRERLKLKIETAGKKKKEMTEKRKMAQNDRKRRQRGKLHEQKKSLPTAANIPLPNKPTGRPTHFLNNGRLRIQSPLLFHEGYMH